MSESATHQRARVLAYLREYGSASTLRLRQTLDILHPAARVQELRGRGYPIRTIWTTDTMPNGRPHRVALYLLTTETTVERGSPA